MTRTLARQMSGPVPSPSMKGMMGLSGTTSLPSRMAILAPCAGGVTLGLQPWTCRFSWRVTGRASVAGRAMLAHAPPRAVVRTKGGRACERLARHYASGAASQRKGV